MLKHIVEPLLPWGTRRRYYVTLVVSGFRVIRGEGLRSFWKKAVPTLIGLLSPKSNEKYNLWKPPARINPKMLPLFQPKFSLKDAKTLVFPLPTSKPEVSIIIPVFNKLVYTLNCLKSISENTSGDYEVIVVDDCSTDNTKNELSQIKNLRLIRNESNSGFIFSCNRGAQASAGKYLVFLNNDTMVIKNWLLSMLKLTTRPEVGVVGSKLLFPDGKVQEAGGIIWKMQRDLISGVYIQWIILRSTM
jgi:O-antigen biosynthesis protein